MTGFSRTWWGQRFTAALEAFTDRSRLERGHPYASGGRVEDYRIKDGVVTATVRGRVNAYFGVYQEPHYTTRIALTHYSAADWTAAIAYIAGRADLVIKLLMHEMPDNIDDAFAGLGSHLLPQGESDFTTSCSCPDYENPCKHIAAVYYLLAADLDQDPFLLFELRGMPRERLGAELAQSPLGQTLAAELAPDDQPMIPSSSFFMEPAAEPQDESVDYRAFWMGRKLPPPPVVAPAAVPALLLKTQGDNPAFWHKDTSFIEAMEEWYARVRAKSPNLR